jgi:hypothetical protein
MHFNIFIKKDLTQNMLYVGATINIFNNKSQILLNFESHLKLKFNYAFMWL